MANQLALIHLLILVPVGLLVAWVTALFEERSAVKVKWGNESTGAAYTWWMIIILGYIYVYVFVEENQLLLVLLSIHGINGLITAIAAYTRGRSWFLWFFNGTISYLSALIILEEHPRIVKRRKISSCPPDTKERIDNLNDLVANGLLDEQSADQSLKELLKTRRLNEAEVLELQKRRKLLRRSYKLGNLTKEEYKRKLENLK
jgi:hypothetical protein